MSFLFDLGCAGDQLHFREIALTARCARCYRASASLILARGLWQPRCIPRRRAVCQDLSGPSSPPCEPCPPVHHGPGCLPGTRPKRSLPAPFWTSHGPWFHPWTRPLFRQRLRPGRSLSRSLHGPPIDRGTIPPDPVTGPCPPPLLIAVLFRFWVNLAFTRSNLL